MVKITRVYYDNGTTNIKYLGINNNKELVSRCYYCGSSEYKITNRIKSVKYFVKGKQHGIFKIYSIYKIGQLNTISYCINGICIKIAH